MSISKSRAYSLGFYNLDLAKIITVKNSINNALAKLFDKLKNPNEVPLDLIVDAGVSNIAQYIMSRSLAYNPTTFVQTLNSAEDAKTWQNVI